MTVGRLDQHSTEFGLWLRNQQEISSEKGYIATNVDYIWRNYNTGEWMIIEEKRYRSTPKRWQQGLFDLIDKAAKHDPLYRGFHLLVFERTSPQDGKIWLDNKFITERELKEFLQFKRKR